MPKRNSRRIRKQRVDPVRKLGVAIGVPVEQLANDNFERVDVLNWTEGDQRRTVRSGERQTIRRKPKIDELVVRKVITQQEADACSWYAKMHAARYDTTGITANLGGAGGRSSTNFDHMPKTKAQQEAFDHFDFARAGINRFLLPMFERVVLHGRPLGRLARSFRLAIWQLIERVEGRVQL
jgi:hypothetical protein